MVLAAMAFLTGFARIFHGSRLCGLSVKSSGRLVVVATGLVLWGFSGTAMALTVSAPMVEGADLLVCKLQHVGQDKTDRRESGAGASLAPSACRMLTVTVRIATGAPSGSSGAGEAASLPRRLGNAVDAAEYKVDVCENATGLILFDDHHPFVRRMLAQAGRNPGYGQEVDYVQTRHGFTVQPVAAGASIRLVLEPWFDRVAGRQGAQSMEPPEVESLQVSTTVDAIPGQWVEVGAYRQQPNIGDAVSSRRILGNYREAVRIWVKADDADRNDRSQDW